MTFRLFTLLFLLAATTFAVVAQDLDALRKAIASGTSEEKRNALFTIRNLKTPEASRIAFSALRDPDEIVRATAAASVVYDLPDARAVLSNSLYDIKPSVRRETAYAFGVIGDPLDAELLIALFTRFKDVESRNAALVALGQVGNPNAIGILSAVLDKKPKSSDDFQRRSAAKAIGAIALKAQRTPNIVTTPESFLPEKYKTKTEFRDLVGEFQPFRHAVDVLRIVLENTKESPDTRREAAFALGAIASPDATSTLKQFTSDPDYYLAEICKESLARIEQSTGQF